MVAIFVEMPGIEFEREGKKQPAVCCECGHDGGELRFIGNDPVTKKAKYKCVRCRKGDGTRDAAKSTFPFTTNNVAPGKTIEVRNLTHLRQLEREYGVQSEVYNNDFKHIDR